jgi:LuxR family maltose regulon positive regulatory protein
MLRLELFGGLRVWVDDRLVLHSGSPRRKASALLVYLYLKRGRYVARDELYEALWPDAVRLPAGRLKQTVLVLRRLIGLREVIVESGGSYQFNAELDETSDLDEFDQHRLAGRSLLVQGESEQALAHFQAALSLRRGDLVPELAYEPWLAREAERRRAEYLDTLDETAQLMEGRADFGAAIGLLEQAIREDPLREQSHLELMRLLRRVGRDVDALRLYEALQRRLAQRLQVAPGLELIDLYHTIRGDRSLPRRAS